MLANIKTSFACVLKSILVYELRCSATFGQKKRLSATRIDEDRKKTTFQ